jgi:hypothetical protein
VYVPLTLKVSTSLVSVTPFEKVYGRPEPLIVRRV